ncbi:MAG: hypothetical protein KY468_19390 [Armatimonadetes bacterium]|nr:hypothetical protein [Armatimonadota bacterium]
MKSLLLALPGLLCVAAAMSSDPEPAPPPHRFEAEIRDYERSDREAPPPKGAVLFIGSSSIRLWKDLENDFPRTPVINRGFGGSEIADSIHFADRILFPYAPRMIVLYAGDNDLANGKTPERVSDDYKRFVRTVRERLPKARIAFIAIKPSPSRWHLVDRVRAANEKIRHYAARDKRLDYIDVFSPMQDPEGQPRPELFVEDRLHMTRQGYEVWRIMVAPFLREDEEQGS